jgi:hypothetical protein
MRRFRSLLLILALAPLASCQQGDRGAPAVTRPREGGEEIDVPAGGFRAVAGQTIYVPAYSSILTSNNPDKFNLAVTLSLRNADREHPIVVTSVRYYDHDGKLVHDYLKRPLRVGPMAAVELFVGEKDTRGGVSASFLVEWLAETPVASPVVESVMIGIGSTQGISFTSRGRVVADLSKPASPPSEGR